ncbi:hypothetical protein LZ30DRAFT_204313 [Colletotrichum cereale]|nr:hypothetical protein LZ30DRAFT_204313 [Colletotrichum cereale]
MRLAPFCILSAVVMLARAHAAFSIIVPNSLSRPTATFIRTLVGLLLNPIIILALLKALMSLTASAAGSRCILASIKCPRRNS